MAAAADPAAPLLGEEVREEEGGTGEASSLRLVTFDIPEDDGEIRPVYIFRYRRPSYELLRVPELDAAGPVESCVVGSFHFVVQPARRGAPLQCCWDSTSSMPVAFADPSANVNLRGQLGVGDTLPRRGLCQTEPPLTAAAVCTAGGGTAVLRSDGTVLTWGNEEMIGREGRCESPGVVSGLPPVALLSAGGFRTIVITTEDEAYGWGELSESFMYVRRPVRIPFLSGRRICRLACGGSMAVAETRRGELLVWGEALEDRGEEEEGKEGSKGGDDEPLEQPVLLRPVEMRFPLRSLVCCADDAAAVDAEGTLWTISDGLKVSMVKLPQRAVHLAQFMINFVVLTEEGELWATDCRVCIRAARSQRPLAIVPYGGPESSTIAFLPDYCAGKGRLRLLARIAMRVGIPSGPVQHIITPLMVHGVYITGPQDDPFGCPVARD